MSRGLAAAVVLAAALACYAPTVGYGFTGWDDTAYIGNNPHVTSADQLDRIWTSSDSDAYYPLTFTSFWLEYRLWDIHPAGYHATNVLLHALDALLVFVFLVALGLRTDGAFVGALLFAVHPLQVISVAWVAERKNLLACLFTLLTLLAWLRPGRKAYALSLAAFAAALLSKTSILLLPIALAQLDGLVVRRPRRATVLRVLPMLVLSVVAALVTVAFERKFMDRGASSLIPAIAERLQIAGAAPWFYVGKIVAPLGLSPAYRFWGVAAGRLSWWVPLIATCAAALAFVLRWARRTGQTESRVAWCISWFFLMLIPSLGVIPFANLALTYVSDHFLYVSMVGVAGIAGMAYVRLRDRAVWIRSAAALAGVLLAIGTLGYSPVFASAESMWSRVLAVDRGSYAGNLGLAEVLTDRGRMDEAMPYYDRAISIRPAAVDAYLFRGEALELAKDAAGAAVSFRRALELSPGNAAATVGLAWAAEQTGAIDEALNLYEQAVRIAPGQLQARVGLGAMYLGFARPEDALPQFQAAIEIRPGYARAYLGAATSLRSLSRYAEAADVLRRGVASNGFDVRLQNLLALTLATAPDERVRDGAQAVALAERARRALGGANGALLDTLAAAYAEAGRFEDAVRTSELAESLPGDAVETRRRTQLYREGKPLRIPAAQPAAKPLDQAH